MYYKHKYKGTLYYENYTFFYKKPYFYELVFIINHASWGLFIGLYRLVLPIWNPQNIYFLLIEMIFHQSQQILQDTHKCKLSFFSKIFFYKNCVFTKIFFMLNQSSWGCFLDHLDLPYQFGILIMSTFCWNEIFFTKANWIYAIWINVSPVFFASPLTYNHFFFHFYYRLHAQMNHDNYSKIGFCSISLSFLEFHFI